MRGGGTDEGDTAPTSVCMDAALESTGCRASEQIAGSRTRKPPAGLRYPVADARGRHRTTDRGFLDRPIPRNLRPDAVYNLWGNERGEWVEARIGPLRYEEDIRPSLARRLVHQLLRVAPHARRP